MSPMLFTLRCLLLPVIGLGGNCGGGGELLRALLMYWLARLPVSEDDDGEAFSLLGRRPNARLNDPLRLDLRLSTVPE